MQCEWCRTITYRRTKRGREWVCDECLAKVTASWPSDHPARCGDDKPTIFEVGQRVRKLVGDYRYEGFVVAVFRKRSGLVRYVVENDDGLLFIFNAGQLELA
jgi:hypothetical protein